MVVEQLPSHRTRVGQKKHVGRIASTPTYTFYIGHEIHSMYKHTLGLRSPLFFRALKVHGIFYFGKVLHTV